MFYDIYLIIKSLMRSVLLGVFTKFIYNWTVDCGTVGRHGPGILPLCDLLPY